MKSCNFLLTTFIPLLWAPAVLAHPVEVLDDLPPPPQRRYQACEPIGTYTTDWFLSTPLPDYHGIFNNTALFYTRGLTSRAISHATAHGLTTIWAVWPCYLYNHLNTTDNPMRCIHNDATKRTMFYENMSRAFAKKANGSVVVMHGADDYDKPPMDGIWGRVELPTMKDGDGVSSVGKIKDDGSEHKVVWRRKSEKVDHIAEEVKQERIEMKKRDVELGAQMACLRASEYDWYDNIDW
ncbi:hypothetical protein BDV96DRAFT_577895 [Lophiotrema nucula]|uniref:Uncharacterized protein n=1 Tax=Lophiotrema nucula TaxID=690887 RepID=A0A6A5Z3B6_9PLEO|nr:hypothetical protein BDV96DRAFT_577895 [Lophiotrema nucula]